MNYLHAVILSIIEGLTEFLPISSTGHLILAVNLLQIPDSDFVKNFEIIIQLGAILAVATLYYRKIIRRKDLYPRVLAAFIPALVVGFIFYGLIKRFLLGNPAVVLTALLLGGITLIAVDRFVKTKKASISDLTIRQSVIIGLFQTISMIPGISRSAATIVGGLMVGLSRTDAVEFSFLLAIPTMAAATGLDLIKSSFLFSPKEILILLIGFMGAFLSALAAVRTFISYVQKHNFTGFGIYRICISVLYWFFIIRQP